MPAAMTAIRPRFDGGEDIERKKGEFAGHIRLFFQQAEEIGQGARQFVSAGLLEGVDRVFGTHVTSGLTTGKISLTKGPQNASCDYFKISVTGKGAHVETASGD